jgi:hypothetical protein
MIVARSTKQTEQIGLDGAETLEELQKRTEAAREAVRAAAENAWRHPTPAATPDPSLAETLIGMMRPIAETAERTRQAQSQGGKKGHRGNITESDRAKRHKRVVSRAQRAGMSQRATAEEYGIDRKTVRRYWQK